MNEVKGNQLLLLLLLLPPPPPPPLFLGLSLGEHAEELCSHFAVS